jgi:hypothetical protein
VNGSCGDIMSPAPTGGIPGRADLPSDFAKGLVFETNEAGTVTRLEQVSTAVAAIGGLDDGVEPRAAR